MKIKYLFSVVILVSLGTLSSCDLFDSADDISFDVVLPLDFAINETQDNPSGKSYTDSELLDAASDPEVAKYASKIQEFTVNKITYTISGANPNTVTFTNGTLKVASSGKTIASASSVSLANPSETELTSDIAGFNELAASLLNDKQELIQLQGTLSKTPVAFNVKFKFYVTITANAL